ncbi:ribbon-helix-helix protein, CopG family [Candidatus Methylomirabilis sp.]|uniref:Ribbon-helix-helix protein, CopG family n=1 Tax=Candidatus Methylomirabilis tolerans TaxID=3123416 RepID=A0AAJ1AJR7_9BACT|nr:ribbon-helix-helix protein, CopG family [Candidatus Methylomirabilis sp.]
MRPRVALSRKRWTKSTEVEPSRDYGAEIERPLDAEDVALSLLDAKVRAEEARADLSSTEPHAGLSVRLSRAMILQLQTEAAKRHITPSELIKRALMQYRPLRQAGRLSARQAGK